MTKGICTLITQALHQQTNHTVTFAYHSLLTNTELCLLSPWHDSHQMNQLHKGEAA